MEIRMAERWLGGGGWRLGLWVALLAGTTTAVPGQTATAVPKLDLGTVRGNWYELARLPNRREKKCVGNAFVLVTAGDKPDRLLLVNSCNGSKGYPNVWNGKAKKANKTGDGRLKVTYLWPFSHQYWVLALGPENAWALVGSPNHKNLWVLSRTTSLPPQTLTAVLAQATAQGFDTAKLQSVVQTVR